MAIAITFKVDENFTEEDLKITLAAKDYWHACYNIREYVRRMHAGKRGDVESMTADEVVEDIWQYVNEAFEELSKLD